MDGHHRFIAYKELGVNGIPSAIITSREHYTFETNDVNISSLFNKNQEISEAYQKAKADFRYSINTTTIKGTEVKFIEIVDLDKVHQQKLNRQGFLAQKVRYL